MYVTSSQMDIYNPNEKQKTQFLYKKNNDMRVLIQVQAVGSAKIEWYAWIVWATPPPKKKKQYSTVLQRW